MKNPGLLIINFQNDYMSGGIDPIPGSENACRMAGAILQCFRDNDRPFLHIQKVNRNYLSEPFKIGTPGIQIHDLVPHFENEPISFAFTDFSLMCLANPLNEFCQKNKIKNGLICFLGDANELDTYIKISNQAEINPILITDASAFRTEKVDAGFLSKYSQLKVEEVFQKFIYSSHELDK